MGGRWTTLTHLLLWRNIVLRMGGRWTTVEWDRRGPKSEIS
jgi:hypothetical protein